MAYNYVELLVNSGYDTPVINVGIVLDTNDIGARIKSVNSTKNE